MGYNLSIGEAVIVWDECQVRIEVETVWLDDSPAFGEPTDHTNERWPSYTGWSDFCRGLDIMNVMFNSRNGGCGELEVAEGIYVYPLIQDHPGSAPITKHHVQLVEDAVRRYRERNPDHIAQYPPLKPGFDEFNEDGRRHLHPQNAYVDDPRYDGHLCRAEWLSFWLKWAVANCQRPVFVNS